MIVMSGMCIMSQTDPCDEKGRFSARTRYDVQQCRPKLKLMLIDHRSTAKHYLHL